MFKNEEKWFMYQILTIIYIIQKQNKFKKLKIQIFDTTFLEILRNLILCTRWAVKSSKVVNRISVGQNSDTQTSISVDSSIIP